MHSFATKLWSFGLWVLLLPIPLQAEIDVVIPDVPDYQWFGGCTGTGSGILMGYWDRHGFPDFYTGPTAGGVAPLHSSGTNEGIRALWASKAGLDGRPSSQPGHYDDYFGLYNIYDKTGYEWTDPDPYKVAGRTEHTPDCLGDFIGLSQNKWTNMNNECDGNINAYGFVFWDHSGNKRTNYIPPLQGEQPVRDVPSGWMAWTKWRGYEANVYSQLTEFNTTVPAGRGFTFEDLKAEINAGYPLLLYQQNFDVYSRALITHVNMPRANPPIHALIVCGYYDDEMGMQYVRFQTTWGTGTQLHPWIGVEWELGGAILPIRGACGYHPLPKITNIQRTNGNVTLTWHGPATQLTDLISGVTSNLHYYVVERSPSLRPANFVPITPASVAHTATFADCCATSAFYRVKLLDR